MWLDTEPQNDFKQIQALPPACFPGIQKPLQAPLLSLPGTRFHLPTPIPGVD